MTKKEIPEPEDQLRNSIAGRCVHFNGVMNEGCKIGITYESVRKEGQPVPCLNMTRLGWPEPPDSCPSRRFPTPEEIEKELQEATDAMAKYFTSLAAGTCPVCGKPSEPYKKIGRSLYTACGHRIGTTG